MGDVITIGDLYGGHVAEIQKRYERVLEAEKLDAIVLHSGTAVPRTRFDDQFWPLRPLPEFQHFLPLAVAESALVIRAGKRPRLLWKREENFWERAPAVPSEEFEPLFEILNLGSIEAELPQGKIALVAEQPAWGLPEASPSLMKALDALRVVKTPYEIDCIDEANRLASFGHARVAEAFSVGELSELELHLLYLQATAQDDPETPYKNIVALGEHASTLHHIHYQRKPTHRPAESLLLDAGATFRGYCSDVTRTYVRGRGEAASTFAELIARTEKMQQELCSTVAVGKPYEELHEAAHREVGNILHDLRLITASPEEAVESGLTRAFFPHGLGHSLGLTCHDVGCAEVKPKPQNPFLRNTLPIAADQVFTIEPGIYFIEMLMEPLRQSAAPVDWKRVGELQPFGGVRIEDDVRVRDRGIDNLTRKHIP
jgi:Xaa-Pro dipeptidase